MTDLEKPLIIKSLLCRFVYGGHVFIVYDLMTLKQCAYCHTLEERGY